MFNPIWAIWMMRMMTGKRNNLINNIKIVEMAVNITKTSFKGLAVPSRPIIIDNSKIYGILYDLRQEAMFMQIGEGTISEYIDHLVATEQFVKNGGTVSDNCEVWYLPDGIHSFSSNAALDRITSHMVKGMVRTKKYEFDDFIVAAEDELDKEEPRLVISKNLVDRYTNLYNTLQQ